ncbi:hypothetical protein D3C72_1788700 [compost metagenome]
MPTRLAHEAIGHGQTQAGALAHRLGGEERLDCALDDFRRHAATVVDDAQPHELAGRQFQCHGLLVVKQQVVADDLDHTTGRHGIARVDA